MKIDKDDKLITPDPTAYDIKLNSGSPKWTINGMKRKSIKKPKTPGSGRYEYKTFIGEGPKYSFGRINSEENQNLKDDNKKNNINKKFEVPGPGFYTIIDKNTGPKYSMYSRNHESSKKLRTIKTTKFEVPGVGKYELRKEIDAGLPNGKFSQEVRNNLLLNETALNYPEPGKYNLDIKTISTTTPSWSFSREPRFPYMKTENPKIKIQQYPGPGTYKTREYMGTEGPFFTFSKLPESHMLLDKDELKKSKQFPSVGKYLTDIKYHPDSPLYTISTKFKIKKLPNDKEQISPPGPIYNPNPEFSSTFYQSPKWSWALSKAKRDQDESNKNSKRKENTPGPGEYNYKKDNIPQGPQYTMGKLLKKIKIMNFPGPGEYSIKEKKSNWGYTMGKVERYEDLKNIEKEDLPGPGKYTVKDIDIVKCFTFSKSKKIPKRKDSFPGPGAYKIPSSFNYINNMSRERGAYNPRFKFI